MAHILQRSLIIVLPLPEHLGGPKRPPAATPHATQPTTQNDPFPANYNRAFWTGVSRNKSFTLRPILQILGLKLVARRRNSTRGPNIFEGAVVTELSKAVSDVAAALPRDLESLLDIAEDEAALDTQIDDLLRRFGSTVWSRGGGRSWLIQENDGEGLVFEEDDDRAVIKKHLRLWTLVRAFNVWRNEAYRQPAKSTKSRGIAATSTVPSSSETAHDPVGNHPLTRSPSANADPEQPTPPCELEGKDNKNATPKAHEQEEGDALIEEADAVLRTGFNLPLRPSLTSEQDLSPKTASPTINQRPTLAKVVNNAPVNVEGQAQLKTDSPAAEETPASSEHVDKRSERSTRNAVPTYNEALLAGSARHTPIKYLEAHHGKALYGSLDAVPSMANAQQRRSPIADSPMPDIADTDTTATTNATQARGKKRKASPRPARGGPVKGCFSATPPLSPRTSKSKSIKLQHNDDDDDGDDDATHPLVPLFLAYLRTHTTPAFPHATHLTSIATALSTLLPASPLFPSALTLWIALQRAMLDARGHLAHLPGSGLTAMEEKIVRARLVVGLRVERDGFVGVGDTDVDVDVDEDVDVVDVLVEGFTNLVQDSSEKVKVGEEVKEGLEALDRELVALGDEIGEGRGRWIVMG